MPLQMLLAAYMAIISPDTTMSDSLGLALADGHGKAAAHDVAQNVVEDVVQPGTRRKPDVRAG